MYPFEKVPDLDENHFLTSILSAIQSPQLDQPAISGRDLNRLLAISEKYRTLYEIGQAVASQTDLDTLLRVSMDKVIDVTGAQRGFFALIDDKHELDFKVARGIDKNDIGDPHSEISKSIISRVIIDGETICLPNALDDEVFGKEISVRGLSLLSVLCVPIKLDGLVRGLIYVENRKAANVFHQVIVELIDAFACQIAVALKNAYDFSTLKESNIELEAELRGRYKFNNIIGSSPGMMKVLRKVANVAVTSAPILIFGETGTGKELIAEALHCNSDRKNKPFRALNCGAIPKELIESEFFGHVKGSFTGAVANRRGFFELCDGGTIFLDEIGELHPALQTKLLRVLETGRFIPVGGEKEVQVDVRVISATNRDLAAMIEEGTFRKDLYYRLNVIPIDLPPLRQRPEDVPLLLQFFLNQLSKKYGRPVPTVPHSVIHSLSTYGFPGNVRELQNLTERGFILSHGDTFSLSVVVDAMKGSAPAASRNPATFQEKKQAVIDDFEKKELVKLLATHRGKLRAAASEAGMDPKNFSDKLRKYGITLDAYK